MTPKELCAKAADVIEARGWCQGAREDAEGRVCVVGAILVAGGEAPDLVVIHAPWLNEACHMLGVGFVPIWNDFPSQTQAQVVAKLREVAAS